MQQTLKRDKHRSLVPRFTAVKDGVEYVSSFYQKATTSFEKTDEEYTVKAQTGLTSKNDQTLDGVHPKIAFTLGKNGLKIEIGDADDTKYVLPLICGNLTVLEGEIEKQEEGDDLKCAVAEAREGMLTAEGAVHQKCKRQKDRGKEQRRAVDLAVL